MDYHYKLYCFLFRNLVIFILRYKIKITTQKSVSKKPRQLAGFLFLLAT